MNTFYDELEKLNTPWLQDFKNEINSRIDRIKSDIIKEANASGVPDLGDEDKLYKQFKSNIEYDLIFGNWEVLKYFVYYLQIKILQEIIGELNYTQHDEEMFNYFNNLSISEKTRCKAKYLKFTSVNPWILYEDKLFNSYTDYNTHFKYNIFYEYKMLKGNTNKNQIFKINYCTFFEDHFAAVYNLIQKVKLLNQYWPYRIFKLFDFEDKNRYTPRYIWYMNNNQFSKETYEFKRWSINKIKKEYFKR